MKKIAVLLFLAVAAVGASAQDITLESVMQTARKANEYFMKKYADPTVPTNVNRIRPSNLWTRAVYYEGLMALYEIDGDSRYIDYTDRWANFHRWTPRNGINTCDADDQCCRQRPLRLVDMD